MPKRKASTATNSRNDGPEKNEAFKKVKRESRAAYTAAQKAAVSEFQSVTNADKSMAVKVLKNYGWNVALAANAGSTSSASAAARSSLNKIFDKYRDNPKEEPDEIGPEGTSNLLGEMGIGLDDIGALIFSELVQSPSLGRITREGFVDGSSEANAETLPNIRNVVLQRRAVLGADRALFKRVYNHTFILALQSGQKSLPPELATEFWRMLFAEPGIAWHTDKTPWLEWWLEFVNDNWNRAVNKDLWRQTLAFAQATLEDDSLSFWTEESSWPSVIDEFVEWVKTEKRRGNANGDAMDVEH